MRILLAVISIIFLQSCNNQLRVVGLTPKSNIIAPAPYELQGIASSSFGVGGAVTLPNFDNASSYSTFGDIVNLPGGDAYLLQAYQSSTGAYRTRLIKIDSDTAAIDTSFANAGVFDIPATTALSNEHGYMYHMNSIDNRYLLMCGYENPSGGSTSIGVMRLFDTQSESFVSSFGTSGAFIHTSPDVTKPRSTINHCAYDKALSRIIFSGRIMEAGWDNQQSYFGVLDLNGASVPSFNSGNVLFLSHPSLSDAHAAWVRPVITSTHYFIAGAQFDNAWTFNQGYIYKIDKSGVTDTNFGTSGLFILPISNSANDVLSIIDTVKDDGLGNLLINQTNFDYVHAVFAKISQTTGSYVTSFGSNGVMDIRPALEAAAGGTYNYLYISDFIQKPNGNLIVNWNSNIIGSSDYVANLSEIDSTGALVPSFGMAGSYTFVIPSGKVTANGWTLPESITGPLFIAGACNTSGGLTAGCAWKIE